MLFRCVLAMLTIFISCTAHAGFIKIYSKNLEKDEDVSGRYDNKTCRMEVDDTYQYGNVRNNRCVVVSGGDVTEKYEKFEVLVDNDERFKGFKPNYAVFVPKGDDSDQHIEMFFSLKYRISDSKMVEGYKYDNYAFLSYTGKFDFFWSSRDSSPVINRINNPEIHYRKYLSEDSALGGLVEKYWDIAYGHESNGQDITDVTAFTNFGENAVERVSRGWDYISYEYKFEINNKLNCEFLDFSCLYAQIYTRAFLHDGILQGKREEDIFWDSSVDAEIKEYDGLRLTFGKEHPFGKSKYSTQGASVEYRTGTRDTGSNNTFTFNYRQEVRVFGLKLPIYIKYFSGYGDEISTYHERDRLFSFGLQFR